MIANNVAARRRALKLTQVELAARAGLHPMTISKIERGKLINPEFDTLQRLAVALNSTPANLLTSADAAPNAA